MATTKRCEGCAEPTGPVRGYVIPDGADTYALVRWCGGCAAEASRRGGPVPCGLCVAAGGDPAPLATDVRLGADGEEPVCDDCGQELAAVARADEPADDHDAAVDRLRDARQDG